MQDQQAGEKGCRCVQEKHGFGCVGGGEGGRVGGQNRGGSEYVAVDAEQGEEGVDDCEPDAVEGGDWRGGHCGR